MARIKAFAEKSAENNYTMEHWRADGNWDKRSQFDSKDFDFDNSNGDMEEHQRFEEHVLGTYVGKVNQILYSAYNRPETALEVVKIFAFMYLVTFMSAARGTECDNFAT